MTLLLATVLAFGVSLGMMQRAVGLASPWMALMVFLCFLGLAKVAEPLWMLKLPKGLRPLRAWELQGRVYRRLAVPGFGALLRDTPLRLLNTRVYVSRSSRDPLDVCRQVESAEAIHFWGALLLAPCIVAYAWIGRWAAVGGFLLLQVLGNAYPIMHLRWVRGRLERVGTRRAGLAAPTGD